MTTPYYYPLFEHMSKNHGLTLTDSEMDEICRKAEGVMAAYEDAMSRMRDLHAHGECERPKVCDRRERSPMNTPDGNAGSGSATGTKSAITYVGSGTKGPHVIYLADGKRITVGRDKSTKGPAWLVIEDTPVVKAESPRRDPPPRDRVTDRSRLTDDGRPAVTTKYTKSRRSPARTGSAMIAEMVYECRRVQRMVRDVCMDSRSPHLLGAVLNDLAKLESSMDRVYDLIHRKLPNLPKSPNASPSATEAGR